MEERVSSHPHFDRVDLALKQRRVHVAAREHIDKRVANGQPAPHHRMHVACIPCLLLLLLHVRVAVRQRQRHTCGQLFDVAEVNVVVVGAVSSLEAFDLTTRVAAYGPVVIDPNEPLRIQGVRLSHQLLQYLVVALVAAVQRVGEYLALRSASQRVVHAARKCGRMRAIRVEAIQKRCVRAAFIVVLANRVHE